MILGPVGALAPPLHHRGRVGPGQRRPPAAGRGGGGPGRQRVLLRARPHPRHLQRGEQIIIMFLWSSVSQLLSPGGRADPVPAAGAGCGGRDGGRPPERDRPRLGGGHCGGEKVTKVYQSHFLCSSSSHARLQNFQARETHR